jgi:nucleoside-diphosphate-sugar epimerase
MVSLQFERVAIVGASGPTGGQLAQELDSRGVRVRAISRDVVKLRRRLEGTEAEIVQGDARQADSIGPAVDGCDLVVNAVGLPAAAMSGHLEVAHSLAGLSARSGARLLHISSFWSYFPIQRQPVDESHPRKGGPELARFRRDAEDILQNSGAAVVQLPDFYGPGVGASTVQRALREAVSKGAFSWVGHTDVPRDAIFVPDAMRVTVDLSLRDEAYGERWLVPGAGPITAEELAERAEQILGRTVRARGGPLWVLRLVSLFSAELRSFIPLAPHYAQPIRYDGTKLDRLLGDTARTPHEEALRITLESLSRS